ncbi:MAG: hypothetical protein M1837_003488 [Sclerophora amabilis]|nr:MAG: hypothetical protein M1837_003488 [Sclerophora amabilis]
MEAQSEAISTELLFRPSKRQKSYRQRAGESQDDDDGPVARDTAPEVLTSVLPGARRQDVEERDGEAETEAAGFSMADILRMRKLARTRKAGIEFTNKGSNSHAQRSQVDGTIQTLSMADAIEREVDKDTESPEALATVANRFAPQTGQVSTDVNKHM